MKSATTLINHLSAGQKIKRLRIANLLTQQELAEIAGVPLEHVDLLERNLPVPLDSRRRIHKELWAIKGRKRRVLSSKFRGIQESR
jgi:transcriptional regulator with XRE-family HTH domain